MGTNRWAMAQAIRDEAVTPADELRTLLSESEKLVANIPNSGQRTLSLLENMDRIAELWPDLEARGVDLRPEAARWETIQAMLRRHEGEALRELRVAGGLPALRRARHPEADVPWWWQLDLELRARRISSARRTAKILVAVVVVGAIVVFALNKLFPVDPKVSEANSKETTGQQIVQTGGDLQVALANFEAAAQLTPNDPDPWLWVGVTQEKLGNTDAATQAYNQAQKLVNGDLSFYLSRAPVYLAFNMLDRAKSDVDAALAEDPDNPQGHFYLANIYEAQGDLVAAAQELDKTASLADARQQPELTAIARYRLGMLLQTMQVRGAPTAAPTP